MSDPIPGCDPNEAYEVVPLASDLGGPVLNFEGQPGTNRHFARLGAYRLGGTAKVLTILAMLAAPILVATVLMIAVFEIKDVWDQNRLR
jgi:hypothetical protein